MILKESMITILNNGEKKEYKLLMVIQKDIYYIIYTDVDNMDFSKNLYVAKVKNIDDISETIHITNEEWDMIEKECQKVFNINL